MAKHSEQTRRLVLDLIGKGFSVREIARMMAGMVDRTTIQEWQAREREAGQHGKGR